jgi:hypothetical protein
MAACNGQCIYVYWHRNKYNYQSTTAMPASFAIPDDAEYRWFGSAFVWWIGFAARNNGWEKKCEGGDDCDCSVDDTPAGGVSVLLKDYPVQSTWKKDDCTFVATGTVTMEKFRKTGECSPKPKKTEFIPYGDALIVSGDATLNLTELLSLENQARAQAERGNRGGTGEAGG